MEPINITARAPGDRDQAATLLRMAAELVEQDNGRDDSATWRAVDALVLLKALNKGDPLPGIDTPTGRGGRLDIKTGPRTLESARQPGGGRRGHP